MRTLERVLARIDGQRKESIAGLMQMLRIPSVSTKPENAADIRRCAQWLADRVREAGLEAKVDETAGHPVVVGQSRFVPGRPTVLVYGHYDVQPAEPLGLWKTPPFEPTIRDGAIYARGAADDKGQIWAHIQAVRAWHQEAGALPVNVKLLIEGEEEIGSDHLSDYVRAHRKELAADVAVISDTNQFAKGVPAVTYGLRGIVYMEVFLTGPDHDLHSGLYGGVVANPANVLCELLATLHDADGRVAIQGFYDDVVPLSQQERTMWQSLGFDDRKLAAEAGVSALSGEKGYSAIERKWVRPTCDINGLTSGYQGHGAKTVIASKASAKVSMRLVPRQDPAEIQAAFEKHLRDRCPSQVKIEFAEHSLAEAVLVPLDSVAMKLAAEALRIGFAGAAEPVFIREGGSIPVVGLLKSQLGIDSLLVGFGLPDDRVHSPNEKFDLDALHAGTRTAAALLERLAELPVTTR
jgi:acetylornithine deacetylase/succinyl-diaminopimelate desuccinylase-like protein